MEGYAVSTSTPEGYIGKPIDELPTPAVIIDRFKVESNIEQMAKTVSDWQCLFRAHIKTHKTKQGTALQLSTGNHAIIVSTLAEAWGLVHSGLIEKGTVDDILYGIPAGINKTDQILKLRRAIKEKSTRADIKLLIDNVAQVESFQKSIEQDSDQESIYVFIKIDSGYNRAGVTVRSSKLPELVRKISTSNRVAMWGVYAHAGNAYGSKNLSTATSFLTEELQCTNEAAQIVGKILQEQGNEIRHRYPLVLSVGCTPTAHAANKAPSNDVLVRLRKELQGDLELHAGNYPFLDLQQVATGSIPNNNLPAIEKCAMTVLTSITSVYPGRGATVNESGQQEETDWVTAKFGDEALCDAGGIVLSKDTGQIPGFGFISSPSKLKGWQVGRVAQEHGILTVRNDWPTDKLSVLEIGEKVQIIPQHACMVASAHPWFYIIDSSRSEPVPIIEEVWVPWKGW